MTLCIAELDLHTTLTWALGLLALFIFLCMVPLRLSEERLQKTKQKLEAQIVQQQREAMSSRETEAAWRLEMQRQFDAFRANSAAQLTEAEKRASDLQSQLDDVHKQSWRAQAGLQASLDSAIELAGDAPGLRSKVEELELALVAAKESRTPPPLDIPPLPSVSEEKELALQKALVMAQIRIRNRAARSKFATRGQLRVRAQRGRV